MYEKCGIISIYNLIKLEGRIQRLEIYDDSLSAFGKSGDTQITTSAILSGVAESVSLSAQTVFLASHSRLHIKSVVLEIGGKICVGQFHRALHGKMLLPFDRKPGLHTL